MTMLEELLVVVPLPLRPPREPPEDDDDELEESPVGAGAPPLLEGGPYLAQIALVTESVSRGM